MSKYRLTEQLGEGASASVWLAQSETGQNVAIKRFHVSAINPQTKKHWEREHLQLKVLSHPKIPKVLDFYTDKVEGRTLPHLVMEYVKGISLDKEMSARRYSLKETSELLNELLEIFLYLHSFQPRIIHRDLKPSNLIRGADKQLYLIDFGLAVDDVHKTMGHSLNVGTLGYQAPEQVHGDPTHRSDLYSIGVLAFELLTQEKASKLIVGLRLDWERKAEKLPADWRYWLKRMLAENPAARFEDAAEALAELPREEEVVVHKKTSLRMPSSAPDDFLAALNMAESEQEEEERRERERQEQIEEARRRAEELREIEQARQAREEELRRQEAAQRQAMLEQLEAELLAEQDGAWDALVARVTGGRLELGRALSTFAKVYEAKTQAFVEAHEHPVFSVLLEWAQAHTTGFVSEELRSLYIQHIHHRFPHSSSTPNELLERYDSLSAELNDLGLFEGFFREGDLKDELESLRARLEQAYRLDAERFEQVQDQRTPHLALFDLSPTTALDWCLPWDDAQKLTCSLARSEQQKIDLGVRHFEIFRNIEATLIPQGRFQMGGFESPKHNEVELTKPFWMMSTQVTQKLYEALMKSNPSHFKGSERPVEQVSWYDAVRCANVLSQKQGFCQVYGFNDEEVIPDWSANGWRLPTEAEWEYAARGGEIHLFSGSNNFDAVGWCRENSNKQTQRAAQKQPNGWGLYDMSGNVNEWIWDWYASSWLHAQLDPKGPDSGAKRGARGGSWRHSYKRSQLVKRGFYDPHLGFNRVGFRLCRNG